MPLPGSFECFRACERYMIDFPLLGGFLLCPKWNLENYWSYYNQTLGMNSHWGNKYFNNLLGIQSSNIAAECHE